MLHSGTRSIAKATFKACACLQLAASQAQPSQAVLPPNFILRALSENHQAKHTPPLYNYMQGYYNQFRHFSCKKPKSASD
jgi:hypothetical protein